MVLERATDLTPRLRQLTFTGPELEHFGSTCLDQRIKLVLPLHPADDLADFPPGENWYAAWRELPAEQRWPVRTFTPAAVRPEVGEVDVIVARHGLGPATRWAGAARPGEHAILVGPDARTPGHDQAGVEWKPEGATEVLVAGDETALPAIRSIVASLPEYTTGRVLVEIPSDADQIPFPSPVGVGVQFLPRNEKHELGELLLGAVIGDAAARIDPADPDDAILWDTPQGQVPGSGDRPDDQPTDRGGRFAWIAGEAGVVTALRRHLVNHGWDRSEVAFMGYWRRGRAES